MKFWRAVLIAILIWILIFFEVSVLMFGFGLSGGAYYLVHYFMLALFTILGAVIYFRKAAGGLKNGLLLGLIFVIVGSILDLAITVPIFTGFALYNVYLFVGFLEGIVLCMLMGLLLGKREEVKKSYSLKDLKMQIASSPSFERTEVEMPASVSKLVREINKKFPKAALKKKRR